MSTAKHNQKFGGSRLLIALATIAILVGTFATATQAHPPVVVTGASDISVWIENDRGIYPSFDDVVISVQAARSCYATVFVIDTFGFVHVIHPFSPYESAWIRGGATYRFSGRDFGLRALGGRGIAHVFAIASPYPFDYSPYGEAIFVGQFGYRVHGDPYLACRQLYVSLMPRAFQWNYVGVGFARFYVREWVRYPTYLCQGYHDGTVYVRVGDGCRHCSRVYDRYRHHVHDPYLALRSAQDHRGDTHYWDGTELKPEGIKRTKSAYKYKAVVERYKKAGVEATVKKSTRRNAKIISAKRTEQRANPIVKNASTKQSPVTRAARAKQRADVKSTHVVAKPTSKTGDVKSESKNTSRVRTSKASRGASAKKVKSPKRSGE
ncbi:MAG: hypothetical protein KAT30_05315 [Candidatus Krumholzibacteria bacterium]|nr:hypothetical protein [Candidatus Krumholzibacteria bacterium]